MPNRILKESINESRGLSEISFFAEDLYKRLITYADDYGRFNADYQIILARLYPREIGIVTLDDIEDALTELIGVGKIAFYTAQPRKEIYGCFPNWNEHQRVRESKQKIPAPDDTTVNDWYLKRFIPRDMKKRLLIRDKFKCQECNKYVISDTASVDRALKFGSGLFHFDHIVPVSQGGRATEENLRLLCSSCNLRRKRHFTPEEIIEMSQNAETCENSPQIAANLRLNPIQSESESNPNPNPTPAERKAAFDRFWALYPRHEAKQNAQKAFDKINPDADLLNMICAAVEQWKKSEQWTKDGGQFIPHPATWLNQHRWEDEIPKPTPQGQVKRVQEQAYEQRQNNENQMSDTPEWMRTYLADIASGE